MNKIVHIDGAEITLESLVRSGSSVHFTLNGKQYFFRSQRLPDGNYVLEREIAEGVWQRMQGFVWTGAKGVRHVQLGTLEAKVSELGTASSHGGGEAELSPRAPMPGLVRQIWVKVGERVEKGQPLIMMEAMKLQTTLSAGAAAQVEAILVKEGEMITEGAELVRLKEIK